MEVNLLCGVALLSSVEFFNYNSIVKAFDLEILLEAYHIPIEFELVYA